MARVSTTASLLHRFLLVTKETTFPSSPTTERIHDTPHKELFERPVRQFSHGCIRVEKPLELAEYLLRGDPRWTQEELLRALDGSVDRAVKSPRPIAVHVLYWTTIDTAYKIFGVFLANSILWIGCLYILLSKITGLRQDRPKPR